MLCCVSYTSISIVLELRLRLAIGLLRVIVFPERSMVDCFVSLLVMANPLARLTENMVCSFTPISTVSRWILSSKFWKINNTMRCCKDVKRISREASGDFLDCVDSVGFDGVGGGEWDVVVKARLTRTSPIAIDICLSLGRVMCTDSMD